MHFKHSKVGFFAACTIDFYYIRRTAKELLIIINCFLFAISISWSAFQSQQLAKHCATSCPDSGRNIAISLHETSNVRLINLRVYWLWREAWTKPTECFYTTYVPTLRPCSCVGFCDRISTSACEKVVQQLFSL